MRVVSQLHTVAEGSGKEFVVVVSNDGRVYVFSNRADEKAEPFWDQLPPLPQDDYVEKIDPMTNYLNGITPLIMKQRPEDFDEPPAEPVSYCGCGRAREPDRTLCILCEMGVEEDDTKVIASK
jgi:hypothetical protein